MANPTMPTTPEEEQAMRRREDEQKKRDALRDLAQKKLRQELKLRGKPEAATPRQAASPAPRIAPPAPAPTPQQAKQELARQHPPAGGGAAGGVAEKAGQAALQTGAKVAVQAGARAATMAAASASAPFLVPVALGVVLVFGVLTLGLIIFMVFAGAPGPQKGISGHVPSDPKGSQTLALAARGGDPNAQKVLALKQIDDNNKLVARWKQPGGLCANPSSDSKYLNLNPTPAPNTVYAADCKPFPPETQTKLNGLFDQITGTQNELTNLIGDTTSDQFLQKLTDLHGEIGQVLITANVISWAKDGQDAYTIFTNAPSIVSWLNLQLDHSASLGYPQPYETFNALQTTPDSSDGKQHRRNGYLFEADPYTNVYANWDGTVSSIDQWNDGTTGVRVQSTSGSFDAFYGHIIPSVTEGQVIKRGDLIGQVADKGADSSVAVRVRSTDGRWIDWAVDPWRIRPSVGENDSADTVEGAPSQ